MCQDLLIVRNVYEVYCEYRDTDKQATEAKLEDDYVRQAAQASPLPRCSRFIRFWSKCSIQSGGEGTKVVFDGVIQRSDHLYNRVLPGSSRAHASLISEVKLDWLHRYTVVRLTARWVTEDHLQQ